MPDFSFKIHQILEIQFRLGLRPDPTGQFTTSSDLLSTFGEGRREVRGRKKERKGEREERGRED